MNLVGGFKPSEKYEFVNWDDDIPNIWENKTCSKPPTRNDGVIYEITTWRWIHMDTTVVMWSCYQANLWAHNDFIAKNSSKLPLQGASPASVQSACPDTIKINQAQSHHLSISVGVKKLWFISLLYFQQVAQQGSKPWSQFCRTPIN